MGTRGSGSWDSLRESFAEQFEQDAAGFVYRKSQKGEAIRVSADEQSRFVEEFDRSLNRSKWLIFVGVAIALAAFVLWPLRSGKELSDAVIIAGLAAMMVPYLVYYYRAWGAPARELAGRTPVAGRRSRDEVQRLNFRRMTYGQLAAAAGGGLLIPFIGSSHGNVFSGWNRLWLVFGGALVLLGAIQAFRKWRFEQEDALRNVIPPSPTPSGVQTSGDSEESRTRRQLWRYLPLALLVLAFLFIGYTPAGKQLVQTPAFFPILMVALGGWAVFTVAWGLAKGRIEPFLRGISRIYERDTQPRAFWASMVWNALFGGGCLWLAFVMNSDNRGQTLQDQCYNGNGTYSVREVISACDRLLAESSTQLRERPDDPNAYFNRGFVYEHRGDLPHAIADFSEVVRLRPDDPAAYYYRWAAYRDLGDEEHAKADLATLTRLSPKVAATVQGNRAD